MLATARAPANSDTEAVDFLSRRLGANVNPHWDETMTGITGVKMEPMFPTAMQTVHTNVHSQRGSVTHSLSQSNTHSVQLVQGSCWTECRRGCIHTLQHGSLPPSYSVFKLESQRGRTRVHSPQPRSKINLCELISLYLSLICPLFKDKVVLKL